MALTLNWAATRAVVGGAGLDVLVYADSLSEPMNYFLQLGRIAPVQVLFWGNPITSGKAAVDYFVSGDRMELPCRTRERFLPEHSSRVVRLALTPLSSTTV